MKLSHSHLALAFTCLAGVVSSTGVKPDLRDATRDHQSQDRRPLTRAGAEGFSRSRWIAQRMKHVRLSSGVVPNPPGLDLEHVGDITSPLEEVAAELPVRVNTDLLPPSTVAQPETQAEPYLAANPQNDDNLIAVYQEHRFANGGARALNYSVSFDAGATWKEGLLPAMTTPSGGSWQKASDPWVAFGPDNRAYAASLLFNETNPANAIGVSRSLDGGITWSGPVEVFRSNPDFNDKEAIAVDTSRNSPHFGNIYAAWDINPANRNDFQTLVVSRSTDGGLSWGPPETIRDTEGNVGAIPAVGPDGTVYLAWVGGPENAVKAKLFFSRSTDGGLTWTRPRKLLKFRAVGVPNQRVGGPLPSFAVDPTSGALHIGWEDRRWTGVDQATIISSRDRGETWSEPHRVSDGPDDSPSYTVSVATNSEGMVAVSYYSVRNDSQRRFLADEYCSISVDGGATFRPGLRMTSASFDVRFAAVAGGNFFLGDYAGLAGTGRSFQALWISTYLQSAVNPDRKQPDVFTGAAGTALLTGSRGTGPGRRPTHAHSDAF
ncbi:MAG TPA: sialidase family protein [Blastocatellia bacterium]|nr:sialidase family protein [Blastocatellia bacterium]